MSILDRWNFHPSYNSSVDVNRTATNWSQGFRWDREHKRLKVENSWDMHIQNEKARNDFRGRSGRSNTRLEYAMERWGSWSTGANVDLKRNFNGTTLDRTVDNGLGSNLFVTTGILSGLVRRLTGIPQSQLEWKATGTAGVNEDTDIRQIENQGVAGGLRSSDSTYASGSERAFESQLRFNRGATWKVDANARLGSANQDSRTQRWDMATPDSFGIVEANNDNSSKRFSMNAAWMKNDKNRVTFTGRYNQESSQFYSALIRARDATDGTDQAMSLDLQTSPLWGIQLGLKGENAFNNQNYEVGTLDRGKRRTSVESRMNFTTGPSLGPLSGIESKTEFRWENSDYMFESSSDYQGRDRRLRQDLRRVLGERVVALVSGEGLLTQSVYKDRSQDRDELRWLLDGALGYRPSSTLETRLTMQWQQRQTINIPSKNARNSNTQNTYRIGAEFNMQMSETMRLSQRYTMTADYSFYDFNENNNGLIRTTEVRTNFVSTVGAKARLDAEHSFRFKDSGQYTRDGAGAPRLYGKATEETYQYLTVTTRYDFTSGFDLHASQRMEVRRTKQLLTKKLTETKKLLFTGGVNLNHRFSQDFGLNVRADQTRSTSERSYWRVTASIDRLF